MQSLLQFPMLFYKMNIVTILCIYRAISSSKLIIYVSGNLFRRFSDCDDLMWFYTHGGRLISKTYIKRSSFFNTLYAGNVLLLFCSVHVKVRFWWTCTGELSFLFIFYIYLFLKKFPFFKQ